MGSRVCIRVLVVATWEYCRAYLQGVLMGKGVLRAIPHYVPPFGSSFVADEIPIQPSWCTATAPPCPAPAVTIGQKATFLRCDLSAGRLGKVAIGPQTPKAAIQGSEY